MGRILNEIEPPSTVPLTGLGEVAPVAWSTDNTPTQLACVEAAVPVTVLPVCVRVSVIAHGPDDTTPVKPSGAAPTHVPVRLRGAAGGGLAGVGVVGVEGVDPLHDASASIEKTASKTHAIAPSLRRFQVAGAKADCAGRTGNTGQWALADSAVQGKCFT
jgi:hypothetical protein